MIRLYTALPKTTEAQVIGKQMLRSGTSVGAHYREAVRSRSDAEFVSKIEGGLQELEEAIYWMELLEETGLNADGQGVRLLRIFLKSIIPWPVGIGISMNTLPLVQG